MPPPRQQKTLFDPKPELYDDGAAEVFADVAFPKPVRMVFSYAVPKLLEPHIAPGKRVLAPFGKGNHRTLGFCVGVSRVRPAGPVKRLHDVADPAPLLSPELLELTRWMSERYACPWGLALDGVVPRAVKGSVGTRWALLVHALPAEGKDPTELTPKQRRAYDVLRAEARPLEMRELAEASRCGPEVVKELLKRGWAAMSRVRLRKQGLELPPAPPREAGLALSAAQATAVGRIVAAVRDRAPQTLLLHGVTGSGKTEVYLQAIAECVRLGRNAICLVPEISLTPQTIDRFRRRFERVAVLHSRLSDVDRAGPWRSIADGVVQVVVGARSALFAPCPDLGLIVIDEEHEATFKQESAPRYHARDVARERCRRERAPLVLGSATPALESWHAAETGACELLSLPDRVTGQPLPRVQIVDLRQEFKMARRLQALSEPLAAALHATLDAGGQAILLLNRRGFSTVALCPLCGAVEKCQHCELALTFHKDLDRMICHLCDAECPPPTLCKKCGGQALRYAGLGTEQLEAEVRQRFPRHPCRRMDSDTMNSLKQYEETLEAFRTGEVRILLGTQMIAKGLDFPNVRLVGVANADTALHLPDFRAAERTFQLVAQVAGRTGRGEHPGKVIVQTFHPDDPAIRAAARHDYVQFVRGELPHRKNLGYPPYRSLCRVIVRAPREDAAAEAAALLVRRLRGVLPADGSIRLLGPAPAPIPKAKDFFRRHFQLHGPDAAAFIPLLNIIDDTPLPADAETAIDVDPVSML